MTKKALFATEKLHDQGGAAGVWHLVLKRDLLFELRFWAETRETLEVLITGCGGLEDLPFELLKIAHHTCREVRFDPFYPDSLGPTFQANPGERLPIKDGYFIKWRTGDAEAGQFVEYQDRFDAIRRLLRQGVQVLIMYAPGCHFGDS